VLSGKCWEVIPCADGESRARLARELNISEITAGCLIRRGYPDTESAKKFLFPRLRDLSPPDRMADLPRGAARLADAIMARERIGVFGDYDVDGLTSTALMYLFLRETASTVEVRTANRFSGGYGLDVGVVDGFRDSGCGTIVVVDCGTSDHEAIDRATACGMDVIVVDHHRVDVAIPRAYAFINPQRHDCGFDDKNLAAVGLTFYFCAAVKSRLVHLGFLSQDEIDMRKYLDLVALGTIADVVPLDGNNRILVSHGMKVLSEHRRPGIEAMVTTARIHARTFTAAHISFQLAPRLNAAGRLSDAMNAFELLVSTVQTDAMEYAGVLEQMTHERREIEAQVSAEARRIAAEQAKENPRIMVVNGAGWHKGVLGIVAARLSDEFQMPVYVIGVTGGVGTGSARGAGQLNLYDSLNDCADLLLRYGGHRDAAGFSVAEEHIPSLRQRLQVYADGHWTQARRNAILCDATLHPSQLTRRFYNELQLLGPFGFQNPEPVFQIDGLDVLSARVVGTGHLKLQLKTPTGSIAAFGPGMGTAAEGLPSPICVAASLSSDEWWGDDAIELRLVAPPLPGGAGESF